MIQAQITYELWNVKMKPRKHWLKMDTALSKIRIYRVQQKIQIIGCSNIQAKVEAGQTDRVILNISDWTGDMNALKKQLADWPITGLKELIAIDGNGKVIHLFP